MSSVRSLLRLRASFRFGTQLCRSHHHGPKPTGLLAATITPFKENGDVDYDGIPKYIDFLNKNGVHGVFLNGSGGEFPSLTVDERKNIQKIYLDYGPSHGLEHIVVHCGSACLRDTIELAKHARANGARSVSSIVPYYYPPRAVDAQVDYCKAICDAVPDAAFYLYHFPLFTKCPVSLTQFLEAARTELPTLEGVKYTDTDLPLLDSIMHFDKGRYNILIGMQTVFLSGLAHGLRGPGIGGQFNYMPSVFTALQRAFDAGDFAAAQREQAKVNRNMQLLNEYSDYGLFQAIRECVTQLGVDFGPPRLPLKRMSRERSAQMRKELENAGFFEFCAKP